MYLVTGTSSYGETTFSEECHDWESVKLAVSSAVTDENIPTDSVQVWQNIPVKIGVFVEVLGVDKATETR